MSMMEPRMPMAEPWAPSLLRSAIWAALAEVTTEMVSPRKMLKASRATKESGY